MAKRGRNRRIKQKRHEEDSPEIERPRESVPSNDDEKAFLGRLFRAKEAAEEGELDEALTQCSELLNEYPDNPEAIFIIAYIFIKAERYGLAFVFLQHATRIVPERSEVWNNVGLTAAKLGRLEQARKFLTKALDMDPKSWAALNNMALVNVNDCKPAIAVEYAKRSIAIDPEQSDAKESLGYAQLMLKNWEEGWAGYEAAVGGKYRKIRTYGAEPYYDGTQKGTILVQGEQGLGDEISFTSLLDEIAGDHPIIFECDSRLEGVFRRSFPDVEIHGTRYVKRRNWKSDLAASALIGSFAGKYRKTDQDFPGKAFLKPDPERCLQWKALLDTLPGKKIGIAWTGGLFHTFQERRSMKLEQMEPLLKLPYTWISLQYKNAEAECEAFEKKTGIKVRHYRRATETNDYDDTVALIQELDLVITVTTAVVDACGAIGKPCWVLVPARPHWRFALDGSTSVWYKSLQLYRQPVEGDWTSVLGQVGRDLKNLPGFGLPPADSWDGSVQLDNPPGFEAGLYYPLDSLSAPFEKKGTDRVHV